MSEVLRALDYWAYQIVAATWELFWPSFLIVAAFTLVERLFPRERGQPWSVVRFNVLWQIIALAMMIALSWSVWGDFTRWAIEKLGAPLFNLARSDTWFIEAGRIVFGLVLNDMVLYWLHRAMHAVPALWAIHRFHHEETHLHAATSIRQHWLNFPTIQLMLLPAAWLWTGDAVPQWAGLLVVAVAAFHHANIRLGMGFLTTVIVGPDAHRIHHARERVLHDSNFAALFPLWDILFGTWRDPRKTPDVTTGLADKAPATSLRAAFQEPFGAWREMLGRRQKN